MDISLPEFTLRTGFGPELHPRFFAGIRHVVSPGQIVAVESIAVMPKEYLKRLLRSVPLACGSAPYAATTISLERIDPNGLLVGQKFVQHDKYASLLENFSRAFDGFCVTRGGAKCNAMIIIGTDADGVPSLAHYVPPIIEAHGDRRILLDGMHRNFLVMSIGTTMEAAVLRQVGAPFPCEQHRWDPVTLVDAKPPPEERYFGIDRDLFRLLRTVGIDG